MAGTLTRKSTFIHITAPMALGRKRGHSSCNFRNLNKLNTSEYRTRTGRKFWISGLQAYCTRTGRKLWFSGLQAYGTRTVRIMSRRYDIIRVLK